MHLLHVKKSIVLFLMLAGSVRAQQAQFPTVAALEQADIPVRDRVELAQRFLGVGAIPPPPTSAPARSLGEQETFWVSNSDDDHMFQVNAVLSAVGEHIYLWVQDGVFIPDYDLQALADAFDDHIYNSVRDLWGSENTPGIDGDPHVYGLFAMGLGSGVGGYFISEHTYPVEVVSTSNQHEMFFFNLDTLGTEMIGTMQMQGLVAHEFQHMIRFNLEANEDVWLNEGLSEFTEALLGYDTLGHSLSFLYAPGTQLNTWAEDTPREPHYGAAMMFIAYLYQRYGQEAIHALSGDPTKGMTSVDNVLRDLGEGDVNEFFADWVIANYVSDPSLLGGRYGYNLLAPGLPSPLPLANVTSFPFLWTGRANQYSADYFVLDNPQGVASLDVSMAVLDTAQLVPIKPDSGRWMWYSNRGDFSDTTLTRAFDLTGVDSATLNYRAWYYIENLWDYGYVTVSDDGGATWDILGTPGMTTDNPHNTAYGPGYTGQSGGWVDETLSLDAYAGSEILVRFEMITDDAITQTGLVIDDVSIPEIGYQGDFEDGDDGWTARGWVRIDNLLPQHAWVQAMQWVGSELLSTTRWLAPADETWTLLVADGVNQIVLVVSPFAPATTVPTQYTLSVTAR
jgi:immune inhibitor A